MPPALGHYHMMDHYSPVLWLICKLSFQQWEKPGSNPSAMNVFDCSIPVYTVSSINIFNLYPYGKIFTVSPN